MLAPSGGGLILYEAYGNLYAMTGRKSHLLEDKQIPSVGVLENQLLSASLLICLGKHDYVERIPSGNSQVKDNKIDLLVQQYKQFTILKEESDSGFARFNNIITSLKALNEESKDLSSLALDELIGNLKVHEVVMEKDSKIYRGKKERIKSIALKSKKDSSNDETLTSGSDDEEYAIAVRNFKKFFRRKGKFVRQSREEKKSFRQRDEKKGKSDRKCFRCGDLNHLIGNFLKPSRNI
ncbi:hypothetical protein Tco_0562733 [Tanacetum coccineum]